MEKYLLPTGWAWKTLAEVSEINPRRPALQRHDDAPTSFVPMAAVDEIEGRFAEIQLKPYREVKKGYTYFEEDDVVFAKITPCMENGKAAVAEGLLDGFGFGTTEFHVFRPRAGILSQWIWHYIRQTEFRRDAKEHFRGAVGQQRVPQEFLSGYPIPLPYPSDLIRSLETQRRIVTRVEALLAEVRAARELHRQVVADTGRLMEAVLGETFGQSARDDWVRIGTYVEHIENGKSPSCENRPAGEDEWGVLKVGAVTYGTFNSHENKVLPQSYIPLMDYEIRPGDLLMSRANTRELVGACALVGETRSRLMLSDKIFRFRFHDDAEISSAFLDFALKSPALRNQIEAAATGTSPSMKNISKDKVLGLLIPKLTLSEQKAIALRLKTASQGAAELKGLLRQNEDLLYTIEQAVLAQAFRGEL